MKKILLVAVVAGFAMTSCKKNYTCECTVTAGGQTTTTSSTAKLKKKDAETWCTAQKGSAPGSSYSCGLK